MRISPQRKRAIRTAMLAATLAMPAAAIAQHGRHQHGSIPPQKNVTLTTHQVATDAVEIRLGPYDLPGHTPHDLMPQAPDLTWVVPFDGWLVSYAPSLLDGDGNDIEAKLLHHVAFWNMGRTDFLCPNKEEHIFGAGGEMTRWPPLPGFGYAVHHGDKIRISTMFHNPTATPYPKVYLAVEVSYVTQTAVETGIPQLRNVYPAWFDVMECGESGYDLKEGESVKTGEFQMPQTGLLLGLGGHLHDFGKSLTVTNATKKEQIVKLTAELDAKGMLESVPVVTFLSRGGYPLATGDKVQVAAEYWNFSNRSIKDGAMGIAVGYFLPEDAAAMEALQRAPKEKKRGNK